MAKKKPQVTALAKMLRETPGAITLSQQKLKRNGLDQFLQKVLLTFAPTQVTAAMGTLHRKALDGDTEAAKAILQVYGIIQRSGGVSVINNIQNNNSSTSTGSVNFDSLLRKMSAQTVDVTQG